MGIKIAITGEMRSGKNAVADIIASTRGLDFKQFRFAEGIEQIIRTYFPEAFDEGGKPRRYYQKVGQLLREVNPDVWVNYLDNEITDASNERRVDNFIVTDLRQPNEAEWLRNNGFIIVKIVADRDVRIQRMRESGDDFVLGDMNHDVELNINSLSHDYMIMNNGTKQDLVIAVKSLMIDILGLGVVAYGSKR